MSNVSDDTKLRAFKLCQDYVGETWNSLGYEDFKISPVSGGLSNLLYLCEISNEKVRTIGEEPRKVLLRVYGKIMQANPESVVTDSVVFGLLAEKGMGPKLFGVFTGGRLEEFIEARHLWTNELHLPGVSKECARVMSKFHKLTMPLDKKPVWLFKIMERYAKDAEEVLRVSNKSSDHDDRMRGVLEKLSKIDFNQELANLKKILLRVKSPVLFCHNDAQEGNILLFNDSSDPAPQLQAIDFEYSGYNYRGFDIGNHFCEWCYNYHQVDEFPFYSAKVEDYPSREQQLIFIHTYMSEMGLTDAGGDSLDTAEQIMLEANTYALASHYMWALWSVVQAEISTIDFGYWEYGIARFEHYFQQKKQLLVQPVFKDL